MRRLSAWLIAEPNGPYVAWSDVEPLIAERDRLANEVADLRGCIRAMREAIEAAKGALDWSRKEGA